MQLICKDGDLALVVKDEPIALANVGRVVRIKGPVGVNRRLGLPCWLIEPVSPKRWRIVSGDGALRIRRVTFKSLIEHPDAWLLPLGPKSNPLNHGAFEAPQKTMDPVDSDAGLVRSGVLSPAGAAAFWEGRAKEMGYTTPNQLEALKRGHLPTLWEWQMRKKRLIGRLTGS